MKQYKVELSIAIGLFAALLCAAFTPTGVGAWWTVAFEPLCDGILSEPDVRESIVLQSKILLWVRSLCS